jgi:hypothetical protein
MRRLPITRGDTILIGTLLLLSLASLIALRYLIPRGSMAVVEVDGRPFCRLDLSVDGRRQVPGPLGETVVEVRGGRIRIAQSPCPHQICVRSGWIGQAGQMIVCVPNGVLVRVEGKGEVDGVTW